MLHIYYGDGKGKTTAAMGLALRALGHEKHVTILQFLKDGSSGEIALLRRCGADVHACPNAKFTWLMTADEKAEAKEHNNAGLRGLPYRPGGREPVTAGRRAGRAGERGGFHRSQSRCLDAGTG